MSKNILEVTGLTKKYGQKTVVKGINLQVKHKEIFGILGPNGAGKTTTLEMVETLRPIDQGTAYIDGISVKEEPEKIRRQIGIQAQTSSFYDKVTLTESLKLLATIYNSDVDVKTLLEDVGLSDKANSYPEKLSGGQQQRFSLAAALVNNPKVLFLDEPTTGLDPQARRNVWDLIQNIRKRGITVVLTSHYMEEAHLLCDRVAIMDNGKIIAMDTPDKLIDDLVKQGFHKDKKVQPADLEDVFISLTGKALRD